MDCMAKVLFPAQAGIFVLATTSISALGLTHPPILWVSGVKCPGREVDHSPTCSTEVNNA